MKLDCIGRNLRDGIILDEYLWVKSYWVKLYQEKQKNIYKLLTTMLTHGAKIPVMNNPTIGLPRAPDIVLTA